jgi:hypothetical protein
MVMWNVIVLTCDVPASVCDTYYVRYNNKDVNFWCALWNYSCVLIHSGLMFLVLVKGVSDDATCVCPTVQIAHMDRCVGVACLLDNVTVRLKCRGHTCQSKCVWVYEGLKS